MPLPLIPVTIGLVGSCLVGVLAGVSGVSDMAEAKSAVADAEGRYTDAFGAYTQQESTTAKALQRYGRQQIRVQTTTLAAWGEWLESNERKVRRLRHEVIEGVELAAPDLPALRLVLCEATDLIAGGAKAAVSAVVAQQAALAGVRSLAVAGTGTAMTSLSGVALDNAVLAWLGGGTLASGGGGVAAGGMVLSGIAIAPAFLIGGITLAIQGDRARTQADEYCADVAVAIEEMRVQTLLFRRLRRRVRELESVLGRIDQQACASFARLSAVNFDPTRHAARFQETALLMGALGDILDTPLLDADGNVSDASSNLAERYAA